MKKSIKIGDKTYPVVITVGALEDLLWEKDMTMTDLSTFFSSMSMQMMAELILHAVKIEQENKGNTCDLTIQDLRKAVRSQGVSLLEFMPQISSLISAITPEESEEVDRATKGN